MKHCVYLILLFFGMQACQDVNMPEKPESLIAKDKMVAILTEAYLANAARSVDNRAIITKGIVIDTIVYKNFGVDSLQFAKSNAYYAAHIDTYIEIFQKVEAGLIAKQQEMDSIRALENNRKETIQKNKEKEKVNTQTTRDSLI